MSQNCLGHALDQWTSTGGYALVLRTSAHPWLERHPEWVLPHVMHLDSLGKLSSYGPESDLKHPVRALFGYEGVVKDFDPSLAPPMPVRGIVIGSTLLTLAVYGWAIKRWWRGVWHG